jgi:hypothetical protein
MSKTRAYMVLALGVGLLLTLASCGTGVGVTSTSAASVTQVTLTPEQLASLESRIAEWSLLGETVQATGMDKTSEIAAFLWPREDAQERAADYQQAWSEGPDTSRPIIGREFDRVVRVSANDSIEGAVVLVAGKLMGSDGATTRSLDVVTWTLQAEQWYRTTSFWVPTPTEGAKQPLENTVWAGGMTWSPFSVEEVKTLAPEGGDSKPGEVFLVVTLNVYDGGEAVDTPGAFSVAFYDADGRQLQTAQVFEVVFPGAVAGRGVVMDPGMDVQLTYCFLAPEGVDLAGLTYGVQPIH